MGAAQLDYIRETLEKNKGVRWTLIFLHNPLWTTKPDENGWAGVEKALGDRPYTVFAGHVHQYCKYNRHGRDYYTLPTTGGGIELLGSDFGLYDSITWVTMRDNGPMVANLDMQGILPDDLLTPELERKVREALRSGLWVQPVLSESQTIEKAATKALVTNTLDVPMQARIEFRGANGIAPAPLVQYLELASNSRNSIAFDLTAASAIDLREPVCLHGQYTLSFQLPDRKEPREIKRDCKLALDYMRPCPPVTKPVAVDGKLDEWESLPLTCEGKTPFVAGPPANWTGPKDASFAYALGHDDKFLYVAVRVTDDQIMAKPGVFPLDQDAMAVLIDARPDPERSQCREEIDHENSFLVLIMSPGDTRATVYRTDKLSPEVQMACSKTDAGYSVEYAVPMAVLDQIQGKPWEEVRINVGVNDKDDDGPTQLWWRPAWESPANYPGSGTFKKK
jgi:hypothetical protein